MDWSEVDMEELSAAGELFDRLVDGSHYQREYDAMVAMGWQETARRFLLWADEQGITLRHT